MNMNHTEFESKLKEMVCLSDWHFRYYSRQCRKYKRFDYWIKSCIGLVAVIGAGMAGSDHYRILGATISGVCAVILSRVLTNFRWDEIVSGLENERQEWTRIFQGYDGLLRISKVLDRDEMLEHEFQKVEELRKAAQFNDRCLPEDFALLKKFESEAKIFHGFKPPS
jgi:hypothetical protein